MTPPLRARERSIFDIWPPPAVLGKTPWPYPGVGDLGGDSFDARVAHVAALRRRAGLVTLPPGEVLEVRLPWLGSPVLQRAGDATWAVCAPALRQLGIAATRLGLRAELSEESVYAEYRPLEQGLSQFLEGYLDACAWWLPETAPRLTGALERIVAELLVSGKCEWDDQYAGEHSAALAAARTRWQDEDFTPWRDRAPRIVIEQGIAASGRTEPYRLRPLVLVTENAGAKQWWYGGWGVYHVEPTGVVGSLLAIYGKHPSYQDRSWMALDSCDAERPETDDFRWYGRTLETSWGPRHAMILCAMTGVQLYEWGRPTEEATRRALEAFVPEIPAVLASLREGDEIIARRTLRSGEVKSEPDSAAGGSA